MERENGHVAVRLGGRDAHTAGGNELEELRELIKGRARCVEVRRGAVREQRRTVARIVRRIRSPSRENRVV